MRMGVLPHVRGKRGGSGGGGGGWGWGGWEAAGDPIRRGGEGLDFAHSPPCDHKAPGLAFEALGSVCRPAARAKWGCGVCPAGCARPTPLRRPAPLAPRRRARGPWQELVWQLLALQRLVGSRSHLVNDKFGTCYWLSTSRPWASECKVMCSSTCVQWRSRK
jgi:hypothetical protein